MNVIESTLAAERDAHWDGDRWRSYCAAQEKAEPASRYAADILVSHDPATCTHLDRVTQGTTGSVCLRCFMRWGPGQ